MKSLLQALAWYADTVLNICWPEPEGLPSLDAAAALAEQEAQEDVAEPQCVCSDEVGSGGRVDPGDVWPETPDPLGHIVALLEDIHNILQRSPLLMPDNLNAVEPPADPGPPTKWHPAPHIRELLQTAAAGLRSMSNYACEKPENLVWVEVASQLEKAAKPSQFLA